MKGSLRLLIRQGSNWEDITGKYGIIYGAGQGCLDIMRRLQLSDVKHVIDSDEKQWGKKLILLDEIYYVESPKLLTELSLDQYYIVISSDIYAEEIKRTIEGYVDINKVPLCMNKENLCYAYSSLEDLLFYDPQIKESLVKKNWSLRLDKLINLFVSTTKKFFSGMNVDYFMPIQNGGSKVSFCFCVNGDHYIFSVPALYCDASTEMFAHDPKEREKNYQFRKKYNIGNELTVYEDDRGVLIQQFVNSYIDFDVENNIQVVLEKFHDLHQLNIDLGTHNNILKQRYQTVYVALKRKAPWEKRKIEELNDQCQKLFDKLEGIKIEQKVCHGDTIYSNVVSKKDKFFLIDWEFMTMADPLYDVCNFLCSIGYRNISFKGLSYVEVFKEIYNRLKKRLSFYYKRPCTDEELHRSYKIMQVIECREFMRDIFYAGYIDEERYEDLLKRMNKENNLNLSRKKILCMDNGREY